MVGKFSRFGCIFIISAKLHLKYRKSYNFGIKFRPHTLLTVPDSTSQKFIFLGQVSRKDNKSDTGRIAAVFLDFAGTRLRQCEENDFEKWYARSSKSQCIMGRKVRVTFYIYIYHSLLLCCSNGIRDESPMRIAMSPVNSRTPLNMRTALAKTRIMSGIPYCGPSISTRSLMTSARIAITTLSATIMTYVSLSPPSLSRPEGAPVILIRLTWAPPAIGLSLATPVIKSKV